jgi:thioredoxin 1
MSDKVMVLGDTSQFDSLIAQGVVLVDFFADRCGPCKALFPVMDALGDKYNGKATILKINVDDHGSIAQKFAVMSIPTIIFFKDGEMVDAPHVGAHPEDYYSNVLDTLI